MSYIKGLSGITGLGALQPGLKKRITENESTIKSILLDAQHFDGLGNTTEGKVPFHEIIKQYNKGISEEEIRAWVWYKRKLGVPMNGWDKYTTAKNDEKTLHELVVKGALF